MLDGDLLILTPSLQDAVAQPHYTVPADQKAPNPAPLSTRLYYREAELPFVLPLWTE